MKQTSLSELKVFRPWGSDELCQLVLQWNRDHIIWITSKQLIIMVWKDTSVKYVRIINKDFLQGFTFDLKYSRNKYMNRSNAKVADLQSQMTKKAINV